MDGAQVSLLILVGIVVFYMLGCKALDVYRDTHTTEVINEDNSRD